MPPHSVPSCLPRPLKRALALMSRNPTSRHVVVASIKHPNSEPSAPANRREGIHVHVAELAVVNNARVLGEGCHQIFRHVAEFVLVKRAARNDSSFALAATEFSWLAASSAVSNIFPSSVL